MLHERTLACAALVLCAACNPGSFDRLQAGSMQSGMGIAGVGRAGTPSARGGSGGREGPSAPPDVEPVSAGGGAGGAGAGGHAGAGGASRPSVPKAGASAGSAAGGAGSAGAPAACAPDAGRPLDVAGGFTELAHLVKPRGVARRTLGPSHVFGDLGSSWLFAATSLTSDVSAPAGAPYNLPHAANGGRTGPWDAAWQGAPGAAWSLTESLDAQAAPQPLLSLPEGAEAATTYYPLALVAVDALAPNALVSFARGSGFSPATELYLAELAPGSHRISQLRAAPLFKAGEPLFAPSLRRDAHYYAIAYVEGGQSYQFARAPVAQVGERDAYEFLARDKDGTWSWQKNVSLASAAIEGVYGTPSFAWNRYLAAYLVVHAAAPPANDIVLESAKELQGPWKRVVVTWKSPSMWGLLDVRQQPALIDDCDRRIHVSYTEPDPAAPLDMLPGKGEVVLGYLDLK